jgi:hypothetical protein
VARINAAQYASLLPPAARHASIDLFSGLIHQCASREGPMFRWLVGIVMCATIISSDAFSQQSLHGLESSSQFEQALRAIDAIRYRKKLQCVISTANASICLCLAQKLPLDTYIRSYVSIVNQDKDGQDYGQLSTSDKAIVDRCVSDGR